MTKEQEDPEKKLIPETVSCIYGMEYPYEDFKEKYSSVYEQVQNMENLLSSRVKYTGTLGNLEFKVSTLKQSEQSVLAQFMPSAMDDNVEAALVEFSLCKVAMALVSVGSMKFPEARVAFGATKAEWKELAEDKLDFLDEIDSGLVQMIGNVYDDVCRAKAYAFIEISANPS